MKNTKLTIVIPIYNLEKLIHNTINKLIIENNEEYEIIFINDGSTDKTLYILNEYIEKYRKNFLGTIKIINQKNRGVSAARNRGLLEAKGKYILFLDGDDFLKKNSIKKYLNILKEEKEEIDIYFNGYEEYIIKGNNKEKSLDYRSVYSYTQELTSGILLLKEKLEKKIWICTGNALYKKEFLEKYKIIYPEKFKHGEDVYFINKALYNANKVYYINENFLEISIRKDSCMRSRFNKSFLDIIYSQEELKKYFYLKNNKKFKIIKDSLEIDMFNSNLSVIKKIFYENDRSNSIKLLKELNLIEKIKIMNINLKQVRILKKIEFFLAQKNIKLYYNFTILYKKLKEIN